MKYAWDIPTDFQSRVSLRLIGPCAYCSTSMSMPLKKIIRSLYIQGVL